ncbi:RelA/SpoT domain-containing protein [Flavobacterium soli]|uniref:RelA/SpoT domain-containing protein n=1 Tax=Flavobacterium soli TaxID=344881 RepID=UPI000425A0DE|nr:RelA/SpoT domain-containing protein [Flavobacterium soli]
MNDVQEIVELWNKDKPKYESLGKLIFSFIQDKITDHEIIPEVHYRTKDLISIIKKVKKKKLEKEYTYNHLNDKLGIRIICKFQEEMEIIDTFLKANFNVINPEYKHEHLDFNKLDYISNHYDSKINCLIKEFKDSEEFKDLIFEIQVRTLNQHAWSNTSHSLSYKQEANMPPNLKRKVYRLLSLYELADDEFSSVNTALKDSENDLVYKLLRKLEGKFYKFAKFDFDRDTSLRSIKIILNYFDDENDKKDLIENIEKFISSHKEKITGIFDTYRGRFYEILLLTQPEVFIIWYMLTNTPFTIEDKWDNDFDIDDLEEIKTLWGNTL